MTTNSKPKITPAADKATPRPNIEALCAATGFSRFPVTGSDGSLVGYLHIKDVLEPDEERRSRPVADRWIRPFAPVVAAWAEDLGADMDKVNVRGGAIALGHPLGGSGARLLTTLLHALEDEGKELGLVTMCAGGGIGTATLVRRIAG